MMPNDTIIFTDIFKFFIVPVPFPPSTKKANGAVHDAEPRASAHGRKRSARTRHEKRLSYIVQVYHKCATPQSIYDKMTAVQNGGGSKM
jgi:hypothetical protein